MTTRRPACCGATAATRWRKCSSMSRAGANASARRERAVLVPPHRRDGAALLVSVALVVPAADRADLLAGGADADVGLPAELHRRAGEHVRQGGRHPGRRGAAVG